MVFISKKSRQNIGLGETAQKGKQAAIAVTVGRKLGEPLHRDLAVLVVNEAVDILDEVAALLRRRGLAVHLATSAAEARAELMRHREIGVLVADISLLEGEGLTLAAQILAGKAELPPVELVLITGYAGANGAQSGALLNRVGLLQEPLKLRDIAVTVGQAIGRAAARRAIAQAGSFRTYDAD